ncbi:hypothetical protein DEO72_LG5g1846 [Vigna unguiculata]|uniref:Uncharacterized protein n=1 Tax=Vigna unguiculata TaxID=3917 RepID=A0A4D6LYX8_VIGUN|nr:hypothetical protein DEO72_LG5g1846 [Vigna unguiculata]
MDSQIQTEQNGPFQHRHRHHLPASPHFSSHRHPPLRQIKGLLRRHAVRPHHALPSPPPLCQSTAPGLLLRRPRCCYPQLRPQAENRRRRVWVRLPRAAPRRLFWLLLPLVLLL